MTTSGVSSIIDFEHERVIAGDTDSVPWEKAETILRHQSQVMGSLYNFNGPGRRCGTDRARSGSVNRPGDLICGSGDYCARF